MMKMKNDREKGEKTSEDRRKYAKLMGEMSWWCEKITHFSYAFAMMLVFAVRYSFFFFRFSILEWEASVWLKQGDEWKFFSYTRRSNICLLPLFFIRIHLVRQVHFHKAKIKTTKCINKLNVRNSSTHNYTNVSVLVVCLVWYEIIIAVLR